MRPRGRPKVSYRSAQHAGCQMSRRADPKANSAAPSAQLANERPHERAA